MTTKLFTLLLAVAASVGTMFAQVTINGLNYNLNDELQTAEVAVQYSSASGEIIIPSNVTYNEVVYSVTSIGEDAFRYYSGLTSVTIPNSVTSIGDYAFFQCTGLTSVTIPNSVTSIGKGAFSECSGLTSVTIPNSITSIGDWAFDGCSGLTSPVYNAHIFAQMPTSYSGAYTIPDGIESIAGGAFFQCTGLTSVTIPNSVTSIGYEAFYHCSGLTSVTIPNSVTSIGLRAFAYCSGLTSPVYNAHVFAYLPTSYSGAYTIPDGIESIAGGAFRDCTGLTSVTIPNSVTSIGNYAFQGCTGLTSVTIPNSVTSIGYDAFYGCTGLTSITIPNSVTSIGSGAFYGCTGLTSVTIPNSVTSIGSGAFFGCRSLTSVTIPNSVTSIGEGAFRDCTGLTSVTIPSSVTSIGDMAFDGCTGLTSIEIPSSVTSIGDMAFYGCTGLTSIEIPNSVTSIGKYAFRDCTGLTSVTIPNSVTSIGGCAFYGCTGVTSITIPNSVTSIGEEAFANVANIIYSGSAAGSPWGAKSVNGYVDGYLVYSDASKTTLVACSSAASGEIIIPNSVTSIGNSAFWKCSGMTSVEIPNSVTSIGEYAFYLVPNIVYSGSAAGSPWGAKSVNGYVDGYLVYSDASKTTLVACSSAASGEIIIPNSVTSIGYEAFYHCSGLTSVTIPNSVTSIGVRAFAYCSGLTSVTIPNSLTSIGDEAFYHCSGLTSVTIPNSVTSIRYEAFYHCSGLTSVTIPNSVTSIGYEAFYQCSSLTSVTIPNSVTSIGDHAFEYCSSLTSVTIGDSVTSIGDYAFIGCSSLTSVTIKAETPPTLGISDAFYDTSEAFYDTNNCPIYVPCGTLEAYQSAWSDYASRIQYAPLAYTVEGKVNDAQMGSMNVPLWATCDTIVSAIPNNGCHFVKWSDGVTDNPRVITLTQDTTMEAIFAHNPIVTYQFNSEVGTVSGPTTILKAADSITFSAIPQEHCHFVRWADGVTDNPRSIFLNQDTTMQAVFARNPLITFSYNSSIGSVVGESTTPTGVAEGNVTFEAVPSEGYHFVKWGDNNTDNPRTIYLTQDITLQATFARNPVIDYDYNASLGRVEGPTTTPTGVAADSITFVAIPQEYCHFVRWSDGNTDNPRTIYLDQDMTIRAIFARNPIIDYEYNSSLGYVEGPTTTPTGIGADSITFTAYPQEYCHFVRWSDNNTDNPRTIYLDQDMTIRAIFAQNPVITYNYDSSLGYVDGPTTLPTGIGADSITFAAYPIEGCRFVQWSDGNTDNPRTIYLTEDITIGATFDYIRSGSCGDNLALRWEYDAQAKTLTISGEGTLNSNYTFGLEAPTLAEKLIIAEGVTSVGNSAFAGYTTLKHLSVAASVETIYELAFYNCSGLTDIYSYREIPADAYSNTFDGIAKSKCRLYVLSSAVELYGKATGWRDFYFVKTIDAEEVTEQITDVAVEPSDNTAAVTWPVEEQAATYTLQIFKDGVPFCTLIFNANGQLTGIAFAPGKNGNHHAPAAVKTSNGGLRFTVTGLNSATHYALTLQAKDDQDAVLASYSSEFTTTGTATGINQITNDNWQMTNKIIRDGQIFILRGDKTYTVTGQEIIVP